MKSPIAALTVCGALAAGHAWAQSPSQAPAPGMATPSLPSPSIVPGAKKVYSANAALPVPATEEELKAGPAMILPDDPLEPYLLSKEHGPFMVMAKTFRGPDSEKMALALCKELREEYGLPAYILRTKDIPMRSLMRGIPPTAPSVTMQPITKEPERVRIHDEAAVLVGNEKTLAATEILLNKVKKMHPKCLHQMKSLYRWREAGTLDRALRTTNPLVPAQLLYPKTPDKLVIQMNHGLRSIENCPGKYSLQVAQFSGRTSYDLNSPKGEPADSLLNLKDSPLKTAHDDAERMADRLAKAPEIKRIGQPVFVYHDRTSSRVFVGAFNSPQEPAAARVREELLKAAVPMTDRRRGWNALDIMIVPAPGLTDVDVIKTEFH